MGRGLASFGQGIQSLGNSVTRVAQEEIQKQNTLDVARAEVTKTEGLLGVSNSFSQGGANADAEYSTYGERARAASEAAVNEAAQLIRDPEMRERWRLTALNDALRTADGAADRGLVLENQQQLVAFEETLEANRRLFVDPAVPQDVKERSRADIQASIDMAVATGLVTPAQAAQWETTYLEDADYSRAQLAVEQDPNLVLGERFEISASDNVDLDHVEPSVIEGFHRLQTSFGSQLPIISGYRSPGHNETVGGASGSQHMHGKALDIDLASMPQEERVRLIETASALGFTGIGVYDNSLHIDLGSRRAWGPSYGRESVPAWAEDAIDRHLSGQIASSGAETNAPDYFRRLSPERQAAIRREAEAARSQRDAETRARIEMAAMDAPVAIQNTGAYTGYQPSSADFLAAYGPVAAPQQYAQYQQSIDTSNQAYTMRNVSISDINAMVAAARPTATGEGAAMEQQRFETLSAAAEQTITARTEDPARYTIQNFPRVAEAWEQAATDPTQVRNAMTMTWAAQNQLGIPAASRQLLPNNVADHAVQSFQNVEIPERDRIGAVSSLIFSSTDVGQQRAVFSQLVEAGLPEISEGAMDAMARGDEGAARRLFLAAMVDPSDLPGSLPTGVTPARISEEVQSQLMDVGSVGDLYYGLSDGSAENFERAQRDQQLIQNAVQLRLRAGEGLRDAVAAVGKDLYGDVRVVNGSGNVNARLLLPADQDPRQTLRGLEATLPQVRQTLTESLVPAGDAPVGEASAIIDAATENYINNVMNDGYFRNTEGGYVFIDPFVGAAISDVEGNPIVFTESDMVQAAAQAPIPAMSREQANSMLEANEINEEQHRMLMQEISEQEQRAMGLIE